MSLRLEKLLKQTSLGRVAAKLELTEEERTDIAQWRPDMRLSGIEAEVEFPRPDLLEPYLRSFTWGAQL